MAVRAYDDYSLGLAPAERVAFVLHDMFAVPFDEVAPIVGRSPAGQGSRRGSHPPAGSGQSVPRGLRGTATAAQPALVNGAAGEVWAPGGKPRVVFAFTIKRGKIVKIDLLADSERLSQFDLVFGNS